MVEPKFENGVWVCPVCGFKAMSKKVVEQHIQREHPSEAQSKKESGGEKPQAKKKGSGEKKGREKSRKSGKSEKSGKSKKSEKSRKSEKSGCVTKRKFKLGKTEVRLWDYEHLDMKDQRAWLMFQNRNYVAGLHKQKVRVKLVSGEEFEGLLKARDPYFVSLVTPNGKVVINKAHILYIKPLEKAGKGGG